MTYPDVARRPVHRLEDDHQLLHLSENSPDHPHVCHCNISSSSFWLSYGSSVMWDMPHVTLHHRRSIFAWTYHILLGHFFSLFQRGHRNSHNTTPLWGLVAQRGPVHPQLTVRPVTRWNSSYPILPSSLVAWLYLQRMMLLTQKLTGLVYNLRLCFFFFQMWIGHLFYMSSG